MYQLLLVDDEPLVLSGLQEFIDWEALGFHVAGTAGSVSQALAILRDRSIDVLLTDIVMDRETGFDLIREAGLIKPDLKYVILSGYGDFNYALEAIRLGCVNFLTKPVDFEECATVFSALRKTLDEERTSRGWQMDFHLMKKEKAVRRFLETGRKREEISSCFADMQPSYGVLLLHVRKDTTPLDFQQIEDRLSDLQNVFLFSLSSSEYCALLYQCPLHDALVSRLELLAESKFKNSVYLAFGGMDKDIDNLPRLFSQAQEALKFRHIRSKDPILRYDQLAPMFLTSEFDCAAFQKQLVEQLMGKGEKEAVEYVLSVSARFLAGDQADIAGLTNILLSINAMLAARNLEPYRSDYDAFRSLAAITNSEQAVIFLQDFIQNSLKQLHTERSDNFIINTALDYIQSHLDEKLSLTKLSEIVYVSPAYFSRLFHNVVGKRLTDYLVELRVDRAKTLLLDPALKIYDVAIGVGYDNAKRFSKVFQESTGMTPSEYRGKMAAGV